MSILPRDAIDFATQTEHCVIAILVARFKLNLECFAEHGHILVGVRHERGHLVLVQVPAPRVPALGRREAVNAHFHIVLLRRIANGRRAANLLVVLNDFGVLALLVTNVHRNVMRNRAKVAALNVNVPARPMHLAHRVNVGTLVARVRLARSLIRNMHKNRIMTTRTMWRY